MLKARPHRLLLVVAALWTGGAHAVPFQLDSDNDGLLDVVEATLGTNPLSADSDGDGKPDGEEFLFDSDLDLRSNALESSIVDSDNDGFNDENDAREAEACFPDTTVGACDEDGDGVSNIDEWDAGTDHSRRDTDRDGFDDGVEGLADSDLDGVIDALESNLHDCDDDGAPDHLDADSDNDGLEDGDEFVGDSDGDGRKNACDDDDDGDGVPTLLELFNGFVGDRDDDGIADFLDDDSDGDGRLDRDEGFGDRDGDGVPNALDFDDFDGPISDSDEDGSPGVIDEAPSVPVEDPVIEDEPDTEEETGEVVDEEAVIDEEPVVQAPMFDATHKYLVAHALAFEPTVEDVGVELAGRADVDEAAVSCAAAPVGPGAFLFAGLAALLRRRRR